jgi:hypothetical protein
MSSAGTSGTDSGTDSVVGFVGRVVGVVGAVVSVAGGWEPWGFPDAPHPASSAVISTAAIQQTDIFFIMFLLHAEYIFAYTFPDGLPRCFVAGYLFGIPGAGIAVPEIKR